MSSVGLSSLRGTDDDTPAAGTDEANYWLRVANRLRRNLYRDLSKQNRAAYQILELGTVSASETPSFDLDDNFLGASDDCYIIDKASSRHDFTIIQPQEKSYLKQQVYIAGVNPQTLYFSQPITTSSTYIGGTLYLPAYVLPDDLTSNSTIDVDDPDWLVTATAAKIAFNDVTYESKAADLNAEANSLYKVMLANNRRGTYGNPRRSPTSVTRIRDTRGRSRL